MNPIAICYNTLTQLSLLNTSFGRGILFVGYSVALQKVSYRNRFSALYPANVLNLIPNQIQPQVCASVLAYHKNLDVVILFVASVLVFV